MTSLQARRARALAQRGDGMTIVELVIIVAIMLTLAGFAAAAVFRARLSAAETSAVASRRVIAAAQFHYATSCGGGGFAPSLGRLGLVPRGSTDPFLDPALAKDPSVIKGGYRFEVRPGAGARLTAIDCHGLQSQTTFYASAAPLSEAIGTRSFAVTQTAEVWAVGGMVPPQEPFSSPAWLLK
jgi:type II secretory pathway pseudopilin PulG